MNDRAVPRAVVELVDLVYEAALHPGCWTTMLAAACELVGGDNGYLSHVHHAELTLHCTTLDPMAWDAEPLDRYRRGMPTDPFMRALMHAPARVLTCALAVAPEAKRVLPQYREVFPQLGIAHSLGVSLHHEDGVTSFLGLTRTARRGAFSERDRSLLQPVVPHLRRAMLIGRERHRVERQARALAAVVDRLPLGLLVITEERRLLVANTAARGLLDAGECIAVSNGVLAVRCPGGVARVDDAIRRLCSAAMPSSSGIEAIALSEAGAIPERVALMCGIAASPPADPQSGQAVLMVIHDIGRPIGLEVVEMFQKLYGLPPSLARLAVSLAAGRTLTEAAHQHGITAESGRIYLKRIFERVGVSRQSDLVRRLATLGTTVPVGHGKSDAKATPHATCCPEGDGS